MAIHIALVEPEIPPNTGNVARSCAATESTLHLVKPLGFSIDDKQVRRAGLDYWPFVKLEVHESLNEFLSENSEKTMYFVETNGEKLYTDVKFCDGDIIVFGKETEGLPCHVIDEHPGETIRIPMSEDTRRRSLNLSNAVSIVLFEALRQLGFPNLK